MADRSYTDDEVEAIFKRALERQQEQADGLGHEELLAAAREVGLDEHAVERAVHEVEDARDENSLESEVRRRKRGAWWRHLFVYAVVVGGLFGLNLLAVPGAWIWFVVFGWGLGVALSAPSAFRAPTEIELEKAHHRKNRQERRKSRAIQRQQERERRKQEREARRAPQPTRSKAQKGELDQVIEEGVALLLRTAAKKLREANQQLVTPPPQTDFDRYVDRKKTGAPAPAAAPKTATKVRVEAPREEEESAAEEPRERARDRRRR